ncbi:MAG: DUF3391 domain-containing protein [bacterium]
MEQGYWVTLDRLQIGMYIRVGGSWLDHPFWLSSFKIREAGQIEELRRAGVAGVEWVPEKSDRPPLPSAPLPADGDGNGDGNGSGSGDKTASPQESREGPTASAPDPLELERVLAIKRERLRAIREKRDRLLREEKRYEEGLLGIRRMMRHLTTFSKETVREADALIKDIVSSVLADKDVALHLVNLQKSGESFYHALNVAVLSLMLGKECGLEMEQLRNLGHGALFHDIGKEARPEPPSPSKEEEAAPVLDCAAVRTHPWSGEQILTRTGSFSAETCRIIRQHHEASDGTGYPDGLRGDAISHLARITAIANVYDNLCNGEEPERRVSPHKACAWMFARMKESFDPQLLPLFIRCMGVYPPGTIVQLSDGLFGVVVATNANNSLRPDVLVHDPRPVEEKTGVVVLEVRPDLSIVRSLLPQELPRESYRHLQPRAWCLAETQAPNP